MSGEARSVPPAPAEQRLMSALGWAFDFFSVAISVTDVVSDILVARQFYVDGNTVWAWLILGAFLIGNCVYTFIIVQFLVKERPSSYDIGGGRHVVPPWLTALPRPLTAVLVFPLAQLAPTLHYAMQVLVVPWLRRRQAAEAAAVADSSAHAFAFAAVNRDAMDKAERRRDYHRLLLDGGDGAATSFAPDYGSAGMPVSRWRLRQSEHLAAPELPESAVRAEEADAIRTTVTVVARLRHAVATQFVTHGMLFVETLVESIPQSIIQLLAITFLGAPTVLQVVSMVLSLLSVITKAYFVSVSCDLRVFFFKLCLVSSDVFGLFYVFSSVLSQNRQQQAPLFGNRAWLVSDLISVWFYKTAVVAAASVACGLVFLLGLLLMTAFHPRVSALSRSDAKLLFVFALGFLVLFVPGLLCLEAVKLSWLLLLARRFEPPTSSLPVAAMVFSFLQRSESRDELRERIAHLHRQIPGTYPMARLLTPFFPFLLDNASVLVDVHAACLEGLPSYLARADAFVLEAQRERHADHGARGAARPRAPHIHQRPMSAIAEHHTLRSVDPLFRRKTEFDAESHPLGFRASLGTLPDTAEDIAVARLIRDTMASVLEQRRRSSGVAAAPPPAATVELVGDLATCVLRDRECCELVAEFAAHSARCKADPELGASERARIEAAYRLQRVYALPRLARFSQLQVQAFNSRLVMGDASDLKPIEWLGHKLGWAWVLLVLPSALFSLVFPFLNAAAEWERQNALQVVCFAALCVSLALALSLLPWCVPYVRMCLTCPAIVEAQLAARYSWDVDYLVQGLKQAQRDILSYHSVPPLHAVLAAVPHSLVPRDVLAIAAQFLRPTDIDTSALSIAECKELRRLGRLDL